MMKKKIAILGGGPSALSAAMHLTNDPARREQLDITLYQMGWRLGGKCASSRNAEAQHRIEEHGIHLFGNYYLNAFRMLAKAYDEIDFGVDEPIRTIEQAFVGYDYPVPSNAGRPWVEGLSHEGLDLTQFVPRLMDHLMRHKAFPFLWVGRSERPLAALQRLQLAVNGLLSVKRHADEELLHLNYLLALGIAWIKAD